MPSVQRHAERQRPEREQPDQPGPPVQQRGEDRRARPARPRRRRRARPLRPAARRRPAWPPPGRRSRARRASRPPAGAGPCTAGRRRPRPPRRASPRPGGPAPPRGPRTRRPPYPARRLALSSRRDDHGTPPRARRGDLRDRRDRARPDLRAVVPQLRRPLRAAVGAGPRERARAGVRGRLRADPAPAADGVRAARAAVRRRRPTTCSRSPTLLAFGALVYLAFALGRELFSPWVGVVAALVVLTRPALERDALLAYQDVPFAALVVGAVLLEARTPRRGTAGAARCSPWRACCARRRGCSPASTRSGCGPTRDARGRVAAARALAAVAPVIWAATDWAVTGDPLHSLHGTADLAIANDRRRTVADVPYWTAQYFGYALREPLVLGVPIGLAFAWFHARRQAVLPLAVVAAMVAVFAIGPIFGLPLIRRYIATPAVLLTLFYGLAVAGWAMLPRDARAHGLDGRGRRRGAAVGRLPAVALRPAGHGRAPHRQGRRALRRPPAGDGGAAGAGRLRGLPGPHGGRPPPDALRALLARRRARHASRPSRAAPARWASCC